MKTHKNIALAWVSTFGLDIGDPACMACGSVRDKWSRLERAHLTPRALGGSDDPENIVLLCNPCHREAPDYVDPSFMIQWIISRESWPFGVHFGARGLRRAVEDIGGEDIKSMTDLDYGAPFREFIIERVGTHGPRLTASTVASAAVDYHRRNSAQHEGQE
jgi:hypothetical protein